MKILCNLSTKKIEGFLRWSGFNFDPATHIELEVSEVPNMDLDKLNDTNDGIIKASQADIDRVEAIILAKKIRDAALNSLTHVFGDGRIMQTRPKDESNIRNAIEIMTANNIPSIGWSMIDDVKQDVTAADLQEALTAGQMAALAIWDAYNP